MKNVTVQRQNMISYVDIFGEPKDVELTVLLRTIPLRTALETIAFLLVRLTNIQRTDTEFHRTQLSGWMMQTDTDLKNKMLDFITTNDVFHQSGFIFTDRRACLNLMQNLLIAADREDKAFKTKDWGSTSCRAVAL